MPRKAEESSHVLAARTGTQVVQLGFLMEVRKITIRFSGLSGGQAVLLRRHQARSKRGDIPEVWGGQNVYLQAIRSMWRPSCNATLFDLSRRHRCSPRRRSCGRWLLTTCGGRLRSRARTPEVVSPSTSTIEQRCSTFFDLPDPRTPPWPPRRRTGPAAYRAHTRTRFVLFTRYAPAERGYQAPMAN